MSACEVVGHLIIWAIAIGCPVFVFAAILGDARKDDDS